MKTRFHEQQKLVAFLKQYRPGPPPQNNRIEEQLMAVVSQENKSPKYNSWLWVVPSAIAAGSLLIYGSLIRDNFAPKIAKKTEDLEIFMVNSWRGSMAENMETKDIYNLEKDWLLLTEAQISSAQP